MPKVREMYLLYNIIKKKKKKKKKKKNVKSTVVFIRSAGPKLLILIHINF